MVTKYPSGTLYSHLHCKKYLYNHGTSSASVCIRKSTGIMKCRPTLQCGPALRYSVHLLTQAYAEPVPFKYGKLATKCVDIRILLQCTVLRSVRPEADHQFPMQVMYQQLGCQYFLTGPRLPSQLHCDDCTY